MYNEALKDTSHSQSAEHCLYFLHTVKNVTINGNSKKRSI